jgi:ATP-dependent RNA helicase DeaD
MDAPQPAEREKRGKGDKRMDAPPADRSDFADGVWFRVTVGRKHRAEPRWLLPMICKAGHVTKRAVGSIRIFDTESQFEIAGDQAEAFFAAIKEHGTGEKGVSIQRLDQKAGYAAPKPTRKDAERKVSKFKGKSASSEERQPSSPKKKARWKKTKKL